MPPLVASQQPTCEIPKSDCPLSRKLKSSEGFDFSVGLADSAGFDYLKAGPVRSNLSSRSKPRLTKLRRKPVAAHRVETDSESNGASDLKGEVKFEGKLGNAPGVAGVSLGLDGGVTGGLNGSMEQSSFESRRTSFGDGWNGSLFGFGFELGKGESLFGSTTKASTSYLPSMGSNSSFASMDVGSTSGVQREAGTFVFGAQNFPSGGSVFGPSKSGLPMDVNLEGKQYVFGVDKCVSAQNTYFSPEVSSGSVRQLEVDENHKPNNIKFASASHKNYSASCAKLDHQGSDKASLQFGFDQFGKGTSTTFVFGSSKNVPEINSESVKQDGDKMGKSKSVKDAGNAVPGGKGKAKFNPSEDFGEVGHSGFQFPFTSSATNIKNQVNFVFGSSKSDSKSGVECERNPTLKHKRMFNFENRGEENAENHMQFQNGCCSDKFVFGGLEGSEGSGSSCTTKIVNGTNKVNAEKAEECNGFGQSINNTGSNTNFKFQSSSSSSGLSQQEHVSFLSKEMKGLNIEDFDMDTNKTENVFSNNANNVFVFGSNQKISGFMKENHPINMIKKTSHENHLSHITSESDSNSSSVFSSVGTVILPNDGFPGVQSMNKDQKDRVIVNSKLSGANFSNADYSTLNVKVSLPSCNFIPGIDNGNTKSQGSKRLKKRNGKSRKSAVVQQLFGQGPVSNGSSSQQNQESPNCGSPMDFSPYHDTKASNVSDADICNRAKEEFASSEKETLGCFEQRHDDWHNSNLSRLPVQDGLSAVRRQYKKKYKLKVGPTYTVRVNGSDKENTKQEPIGAAVHEVCEHWRIRGNEAYHAGELSKAEEFYSMGISLVPQASTLGNSLKPLLLCYSNRAATRMSLGRMIEAIGDCNKAAALDPNFLKATLRAGNCFLVLGEIEDAIQCYSKCLNSGAGLSLDRRVTIEAADGLQKAEKVAECMRQSAELLREGTDNAARIALETINEALSIGRYSERLLEMKGEALCIMRVYDDVIQLCEQTLDIAKRNYNDNNSRIKLWRWHLQIKSLYHLGRLDWALELVEKREKLAICSTSGNSTQETSIALVSSIRELLCLKKSGNEAFNVGQYAEAIEIYTAAISKSLESRPFMAICFCNRAAAYQSVNQIADAIADCSIAIALDQNYQKAISRRATLYEMIRDYKQAAYDLQSLVTLLASKSNTKNQQNGSQSKSSGGGVRDLRKARRRLSSIEEKAKEEISLDHYLILGIKASDTESEIKKAYRKAALKHHPDKAGQVLVRSDIGDVGSLWKEVGEKIHQDADRLFKIIGAAYAVLSDPSKRSKYDTEEDLRNIYRDSHRSGNSSQPSTSYSSPYERGSGFGRHSGFNSYSERTYSKRYGNSYSRWYYD